MRHLTTAVILTALLVHLAPGITNAQDYISDAVRALGESRVYVAPNTEGTNRNTADQLKGTLDNNDNIVLIMLPAAAKDQLGVDPLTIAMHMSEALENKRIIGLAVGNEVVAYAPTSLLDPGVAADQMDRADSVSNSPITALSTFTQNVHRWQEAHPQPKPSPIQSVKEGGSTWYVWLFVIIVIAIILVSIVIYTGRRSEDDSDRKRYKAHDLINDQLQKISQMRENIHDPELNRTILSMCSDTEKYFKTYSSDTKRDAREFNNHLDGILSVLKQYVEVQNDRRYYDEPSEIMRRGKKAIEDFAAFVLASCKAKSASRLMEYNVNTNILSAQKRQF